MTVSNEDRDAAARVMINARMLWATSVDPAEMDHPSLAGAIVDALIAHGWGPRPTVTRDALVDHVARLEVPRVPVVAGVLNISAESMADALVPFLRECGIEVTDGDDHE